VGLAISDASGTLARPLATLRVAGPADALAQVSREVARLAAEEDGVTTIVVGLPRHLDGTWGPLTDRVHAFVDRLRVSVGVPIVTEDERLSSREAESRLAIHERDWRARKAKLDAAAAAVFLQDYLDRHR
jgi:putative Holliday junction resolvase